MRFLAVALALLLGFSAPAYAAGLEPMPPKAPPMEAPPPFEPGAGWALVIIPIGLLVACLTEICKNEKPPPLSP